MPVKHLKIMDEQFTPVVTTPAIPPSSNFKALCDDSDGLTILLAAPDAANSTYQIRFAIPLAFLVTDEGDRFRSMGYLDGRAATPLGRIENSRWMKWFIEETLGITFALT
jgi:hypothetical protein